MSSKSFHRTSSHSTRSSTPSRRPGSFSVHSKCYVRVPSLQTRFHRQCSGLAKAKLGCVGGPRRTLAEPRWCLRRRYASGDGGVAGIERGTYGIASSHRNFRPCSVNSSGRGAARRGLPVDGQCYLLAAYACKAAANATAAMALLDAHEAEPTASGSQEAFYAAVIAACGAARAWDLQWEAFQRAQTAAWARGLRMVR